MKKSIIIVLIFMTLTVANSSLNARENGSNIGRLSLTFGYFADESSWLGAKYFIGNNLELSTSVLVLSNKDNDETDIHNTSPYYNSDDTSKDDNDSKTYGGAIAFYYHTDLFEDLSFYFGPLFRYKRLKTDANSTNYSIDDYGTYNSEYNYNSKSNIYEITANFGVQYMFTRRFGIYFDYGIGYTITKSDITSKFTSSSGSTVNYGKSNSKRTFKDVETAQSKLGVMLYLN